MTEQSEPYAEQGGKLTLAERVALIMRFGTDEQRAAVREFTERSVASIQQLQADLDALEETEN